MIKITDNAFEVLHELRRIGASVKRAFFTVGDSAWRYWVHVNVTMICLDGLQTAEGFVRLSDGAKDLLQLAAAVKLGSTDFYGRMDATTIAKRLACSRRRVEYAFAELEDLGLGSRKYEGREVLTFDIATWLFQSERPRGSAPAPALAQDSAAQKIFDPDQPPAPSHRRILRSAYKDYVSSISGDDTPDPLFGGARPEGGPPRTPNGTEERKRLGGPAAQPQTTNRTATAQGMNDIAARFAEEHRRWKENRPPPE